MAAALQAQEADCPPESETNIVHGADCVDEPETIPVGQPDNLEAPKTVIVQVPDDSLWVFVNAMQPAGTEHIPGLYRRPPPVVVDANQVHIRNHEHHRSWLFVVFMLQLVLLVMVRTVFEKDIAEQIRAYFNLNLAHQLQRDQETSLPFSSLMLNINGFISYGVLAYLSLFYLPGWHDLYQFKFLGILMTVSTALFSAKYLITRFVAYVFPFTEELDLYNFNYFLNHQLVGVLLIPLNMVVAYAAGPMDTYTFYGAWIMVWISFMLLAVKGFSIGSSYFRLYKFHFILYICTLEIAPLLILFKVFQQLALNNQH